MKLARDTICKTALGLANLPVQREVHTHSIETE